MKHIDNDLLAFISIVEGITGFIFIGLGLWIGCFVPIGITLIVLAFAQFYVILFTKDR